MTVFQGSGFGQHVSRPQSPPILNRFSWVPPAQRGLSPSNEDDEMDTSPMRAAWRFTTNGLVALTNVGTPDIMNNFSSATEYRGQAAYYTSYFSFQASNSNTFMYVHKPLVTPVPTAAEFSFVMRFNWLRRMIASASNDIFFYLWADNGSGSPNFSSGVYVGWNTASFTQGVLGGAAHTTNLTQNDLIAHGICKFGITKRAASSLYNFYVGDDVHWSKPVDGNTGGFVSATTMSHIGFSMRNNAGALGPSNGPAARLDVDYVRKYPHVQLE